ncbi:MAG: hypothetical protein R3243_14850 [Arenibacter latericius]|nr:hypothetical protein [Arenibacter latericius]
MYTNFCNLLNIWDKAFGTYQEERNDVPIEYRITREMNPGNFIDVYFGEFIALYKAVIAAPRLKNKFLYIIKPPGWSHTGDHQTASLVRNSLLEQELETQ